MEAPKVSPRRLLPIETFKYSNREANQAEAIYRKFVGPDGKVRENYEYIAKKYMIDEHDIIDRKLEYFADPGISSDVVRLRFNHYQKKRLNKLNLVSAELKEAAMM
jgi:hypothetical protein